MNRIDLCSDTTMQDTRVQHSLTPLIPLPRTTMQALPTSSTSVRATTSACAIADAVPTTSPATPFEIDRQGWYRHWSGDYPVPLAFAFYHQLKHSSFQTNLDAGLDDDDVEMDDDLELKLTYPEVSPFVYTASEVLLPIDKCPPATTTTSTTATIHKPKPIGDCPTGNKDEHFSSTTTTTTINRKPKLIGGFDGVTGFRPRMSFDDGWEDEDLAPGRFDGLLSAWSS